MKEKLHTFPVTVTLLCISIALASFTAFLSSWTLSAIFLILSLYLIFALYKLLYTSNISKITFLLNALENGETGIKFNEKSGSLRNRHINSIINRISAILYDMRQESAQKEKYYELILNSINTGVVVLNSHGAVYQMNRRATELLGMDIFTHILQLQDISPQLYQAMVKAQPGDKTTVKYENNSKNIELSLRVSKIKIKDHELRIVAFNDINLELDQQEIDSWIRLTRVLTHEIMNSLTPITSLSQSLLQLPPTDYEVIHKGLDTIHDTGSGLLDFVSSYRKLMKIPTPVPSLFNVKPFLEKIITLASHQNHSDTISVVLDDVDDELILYADENLISQVMTNIIKNGVEAVSKMKNGKVTVRAYCDNDTVNLEVSDNGPIISDDVREQIFIPFFTTKSDGNGIGLSLSKQIMRMSNGEISLLPYTSNNSSTVFRLSFY